MTRPVGTSFISPGRKRHRFNGVQIQAGIFGGPVGFSDLKRCKINRYHNHLAPRVITVAPLPREKSAYALARYSRSADSIRQSIEWVRTHNSQHFLESYYFQYGHRSIADLGRTVLCFEGISELAASEVEDETLWDGQAKSSRYQDFSKAGFITPPEFDAAQAQHYQAAGNALIAAYKNIHGSMVAWLREKLPRPESMKPDAWRRNIAARAFDVRAGDALLEGNFHLGIAARRS